MWYLIPVVTWITFGIKFHLELYRQDKDKFISEAIPGTFAGTIVGAIFGVIVGAISGNIFFAIAGILFGTIAGTIVGAIFGVVSGNIRVAISSTIFGTVAILMHYIFFTGLGIGESVVYSIGTGMWLLAIMLVINSILPFLVAIMERVVLVSKTLKRSRVLFGDQED